MGYKIAMKTFWIAVLLMTSQVALAQEWTTDTATVHFRIRNAGIAVKGTFDSVSLSLKRNGNTWKETTLSGRVLAATIDTGFGLRDKHLREGDYFGVETYPWIRMESTELKQTETGHLEGTFRLSIKEHTQEIPLIFTLVESRDTIILETEFEVDRRAFGLGGKSLILSDRVRVFVNAEFSNPR
ncbi:MAG: YceI family protein, partial [Robiginitalea sp.]|nr:YceI family protein [Robiginitalea sp.]